MAGYNYWFPKAFGFKLDERLGKASFWCWFLGFFLAFMPLYALGLMGATRRMQHYPDTHWQPLMLVALSGAILILLGIGLTILQLVVSIRTRDRHRDLTGDPWDGRTLEWSTPSPPPTWNFAVMPVVASGDAFWAAKRQAVATGESEMEERYVPLEVPRNNPTGFFLAFFTFILGFALVWHIWWLAVAGIAGTVVVCLRQAWRTHSEAEVSADEIARFYRAHTPRQAAI
jgi:cytochrome o ubiquinol oxidase subunit 1